ncbi:MAG: hypothetical protein K0U29_00290 [Gammaproteobacteria bacterium]|nr:hypothetical protein [Gammaproteobacteria bacterium]MCH9743345.1 hypothetical protein [Gammaproteobacteria bacterium]
MTLRELYKQADNIQQFGAPMLDRAIETLMTSKSIRFHEDTHAKMLAACLIKRAITKKSSDDLYLLIHLTYDDTRCTFLSMQLLSDAITPFVLQTQKISKNDFWAQEILARKIFGNKFFFEQLYGAVYSGAYGASICLSPGMQVMRAIHHLYKHEFIAAQENMKTVLKRVLQFKKKSGTSSPMVIRMIKLVRIFLPIAEKRGMPSHLYCELNALRLKYDYVAPEGFVSLKTLSIKALIHHEGCLLSRPEAFKQLPPQLQRELKCS